MVAAWASAATGLFAAVATTIAIVVSLFSTTRTIRAAERLRKDERDHLESIRMRKQRAFAAAIVDDLYQVLSAIQFVVTRLDDESTEMTPPRIRKLLGRILRRNPPTFAIALSQLEVFDDPFGRQLASEIASYAHTRAIIENMIQVFSGEKPKAVTAHWRTKNSRSLKQRFNRLSQLREDGMVLADMDAASRPRFDAYALDAADH